MQTLVVLLRNVLEYSFYKFDKSLQDKICNLKEIRDHQRVLNKIFFVKGPVLEEIMAIVSHEILIALSNEVKNHDYLQITRQLLSHVAKMCEGPVDLSDKKYRDNNEQKNEFINYKTLPIEILDKIINNNFRYPSLSHDKIWIENKSKKYEINQEINDEINTLLKEYSTLRNNDLKQIYLSRFLTISREYQLIDNSIFLNFLKKEIEKISDKYLLYDCFIILHNIIIVGKKIKNDISIKKIYQDFFPIFKKYLLACDELYEYSLSKIEQMLEEFNFTNQDEKCEIYWKRLVKIVKKDGRKGFNDNKLYNCILRLKNCRMKPEWRKWLVKPGKYKDVKQDILKEFYR